MVKVDGADSGARKVDRDGRGAEMADTATLSRNALKRGSDEGADVVGLQEGQEMLKMSSSPT